MLNALTADTVTGGLANQAVGFVEHTRQIAGAAAAEMTAVDIEEGHRARAAIPQAATHQQVAVEQEGHTDITDTITGIAADEAVAAVDLPGNARQVGEISDRADIRRAAELRDCGTYQYVFVECDLAQAAVGADIVTSADTGEAVGDVDDPGKIGITEQLTDG